MKIDKFRTCAFLLFILFQSIVVTGCGMNKNTDFENGITDNKVQKLEKPINSIKDGLPFAIERAKEWRKDLYLNYIVIGFEGEKQITESKGVINYNFYGNNVKDGLDTSVEVKIDMNSNSIIRVMSAYGTSKVLLGGGTELKTEKWNIDIKDAMAHAMKVIGEETILKQKRPKLIIRCWDQSWEIAVLSDDKPYFDDYFLELIPQTGEIVANRSRPKTK